LVSPEEKISNMGDKDKKSAQEYVMVARVTILGEFYAYR
jgi:hypothetical protein